MGVCANNCTIGPHVKKRSQQALYSRIDVQGFALNAKQERYQRRSLCRLRRGETELLRQGLAQVGHRAVGPLHRQVAEEVAGQGLQRRGRVVANRAACENREQSSSDPLVSVTGSMNLNRFLPSYMSGCHLAQASLYASCSTESTLTTDETCTCTCQYNVDKAAVNNKATPMSALRVQWRRTSGYCFCSRARTERHSMATWRSSGRTKWSRKASQRSTKLYSLGVISAIVGIGCHTWWPIAMPVARATERAGMWMAEGWREFPNAIMVLLCSYPPGSRPGCPTRSGGTRLSRG